MTYVVKKIKQKSFKELNALVSQIEEILDISKTIIFIDKVENEFKMTQYLLLLLFELIYKKKYLIIQTFSSNLEFSR